MIQDPDPVINRFTWCGILVGGGVDGILYRVLQSKTFYFGLDQGRRILYNCSKDLKKKTGKTRFYIPELKGLRIPYIPQPLTGPEVYTRILVWSIVSQTVQVSASTLSQGFTYYL